MATDFFAKAYMIEGSIEKIIFDSPADEQAYNNVMARIEQDREEMKSALRISLKTGTPRPPHVKREDYIKEEVVENVNYGLANNFSHMRGAVKIKVTIF